MRPTERFCALATLFPSGGPVELRGRPGLGKSSLVRRTADADGLSLVDVRARQLDPVDLRGLPNVTRDGLIVPGLPAQGGEWIVVLGRTGLGSAAGSGFVPATDSGPAAWRVRTAGTEVCDLCQQPQRGLSGNAPLRIAFAKFREPVKHPPRCVSPCECVPIRSPAVRRHSGSPGHGKPSFKVSFHPFFQLIQARVSVMVYFTGMLIFGFLNGACWFLSVSLLRSTVEGPDPALAPSYRVTAIVAVAATTLASFVQFPAGYFLRLVIWAIASFGGLGLNPVRAAVLFGYLAVSSFLSGLVLLGMMRFLQA